MSDPVADKHAEATEFLISPHQCGNENCGAITVGIRNPIIREIDGQMVATADINPHTVIGICVDLLALAHDNLTFLVSEEDDDQK